MSKLRSYLKSMGKYLFVVACGVLLYMLCEHFTAVRKVIKTLLSVLTPVMLGIAFAYLVNLPASFLERLFAGKKPGERRKRRAYLLSVFCSFVLIVGILVFMMWMVIPKVADSIAILADNFDTYYESFVNWATEFWDGLNLNDDAAAQVSEMLAKLQNWLIGVVPKLLNYTFDAVGVVADIVLAFALSIYLLIDKHRLLAHTRRFIRAAFSEERAERILDICSFTNKTFRGYFGGQIISSTLIGIGCYIGMRIFKMPFPEMISLLIGVFAMIPILGPWLSTVPSAFIILMASPNDPMMAVWFVILVVVVQQIDNNITYPLVVGDAVGLSSAWVLIAIIVFGGLFGFTGLLFAVPVTAVLYRLLGDWTNQRATEKGIPIVASVPTVNYERKSKLFRLINKLKRKKPNGGNDKNSGNEKTAEANETKENKEDNKEQE